MVVRAPERNPSAETPNLPSQRRSNDYAHCIPLFAEQSRLADEDARRSELRLRLITEHLSLAEHIAQRFSGRGEPFDDLLQVARTGLIHAVDRYNPEQGTDFLSFAVPTIMGEVRRHFRDTGWSMRVPRTLKDLKHTLSKASDTLAHDLGRAPTPSEIAAHLDMDIDVVREGLLAAEAYRAHSINTPARGAEDTVTVADQLAAEEPGFAHCENHVTLQAAMATLPARERAIVKMRFVDELTQSQIAQRIGLSQMQVSRLLAKTLEQLRERIVTE
ncbi:SigB/SigF/SigG family RNA polymerase sigma factor [Amycolatopsis vastitatis]|uniref:B/F/G family RNA polymerase sigma-70 factor n=1 Tax=Amycolatopsis vastitatis TaxID=1905142 RepID=A0A229SJU8_9PSEU|nr:SigB/SigF/SigG family RNA polymerase sigma factor [Amycolatopsis vastitatis]OXM59103.1 B/F/G family RNA polymerase sigma-70 factor [Amycolatopsis vastitatis]